MEILSGSHVFWSVYKASTESVEFFQVQELQDHFSFTSSSHPIHTMPSAITQDGISTSGSELVIKVNGSLEKVLNRSTEAVLNGSEKVLNGSMENKQPENNETERPPVLIRTFRLDFLLQGHLPGSGR